MAFYWRDLAEDRQPPRPFDYLRSSLPGHSPRWPPSWAQGHHGNQPSEVSETRRRRAEGLRQRQKVIKTAGHPDGELVKARLNLIVADTPARAKADLPSSTQRVQSVRTARS